MSFFEPNGPGIELGVNIDHIATLRNARGTAYPDPVMAALMAEEAGADAITLHLREDRRHIKDTDVRTIRPLLVTRMNLESAITSEMIDFACEIRPQDVERLTDAGIRVSRFIDPEEEQIIASHEAGALVIELHTGRYANAFDAASAEHELERIYEGVKEGIRHGLKVNAGHGLHCCQGGFLGLEKGGFRYESAACRSQATEGKLILAWRVRHDLRYRNRHDSDYTIAGGAEKAR